jgi:hypothetical protein
MDGDGSIVVDKSNKFRSTIRGRLVISLSNLPSNVEMLKLIQKELGGNLNIERSSKYIT